LVAVVSGPAVSAPAEHFAALRLSQDFQAALAAAALCSEKRALVVPELSVLVLSAVPAGVRPCNSPKPKNFPPLSK